MTLYTSNKSQIFLDLNSRGPGHMINIKDVDNLIVLRASSVQHVPKVKSKFEEL